MTNLEVLQTVIDLGFFAVMVVGVYNLKRLREAEEDNGLRLEEIRDQLHWMNGGS